MASESAPSSRRTWFWLASIQGAALVAFALRNVGERPYDDAYFFKRFALNALRAGRFSWNVDEPPVQGATSQLWQALAVPLVALAPEHYVLAGKIAALVCAVLAAGLLVRSTFELDRGVAAACALSSPAIVYALSSGMETSLVLALLAGCVAWASRERAGAPRWVTPLGVLVVYLARPDAAVLALAILLAGTADRRRMFVELTLTAGVLAAWLLVAKLYYGTALPLPFYAKTAAFSPYDAEFLAQCRQSRALHLALFALAGLPLLVLAGTRPDRVNRLALAGVIAFAGYHALFAVDVMGMHARFFAPALVPLAWTAARGVARVEAASKTARAVAIASAALATVLLFAWLAHARMPGDDRIGAGMLAVHGLAVAGVLATTLAARARAYAAVAVAGASCVAVMLTPGAAPLARHDDDAYLAAHIARGTVFRGLPLLVACLGDGIHVYHSEAGVPGLLVAHGKVTDLAGLLSPAWLFRREDFDQHCLREQPEAIFLPHRNYRALNREIAASRCIRGYERVVAHSASPLHVRADLVARYRACTAAQR